ncbi:MAG: hypothetical protein K8L99_29805, partial [Anaerolineae bacterium]|nr:hypothetical protein [Anaerolineae bacterium]
GNGSPPAAEVAIIRASGNGDVPRPCRVAAGGEPLPAGRLAEIKPVVGAVVPHIAHAARRRGAGGGQPVREQGDGDSGHDPVDSLPHVALPFKMERTRLPFTASPPAVQAIMHGKRGMCASAAGQGSRPRA